MCCCAAKTKNKHSNRDSRLQMALFPCIIQMCISYAVFIELKEGEALEDEN